MEAHLPKKDAATSPEAGGTALDPKALLSANRALSQRVYGLQSLFRTSLELSAILDRHRLLFTYLLNAIGLMRATGGVIFLPEEEQPDMLKAALARGRQGMPVRRLRLPLASFRRLGRNAAHGILPIDSPELRQALGELYPPLLQSGIALAAPLRHMDKLVGVVFLGERADGAPYEDHEMELLALLNNFLAVVLTNVNLVADLERLSITDGLTRLLNRRAFDRQLEKEIARGRRYDTRFAVVLLDIDHFKHYNDRNGHPAGDELLRQFSALLMENVRQTDVVARYGGEEFAIILVGVDAAGATAFCQRLQRQIVTFPFHFRETQPMGFISASFGVAVFPEDAAEASRLVQCADRALYRAKRSGRNRVQTYRRSRIRKLHRDRKNLQVQE